MGGPSDLFEFQAIRLEDVALLEVLEPLQTDAALVARGHLADVLLVVLERPDAALPELVPSAGQLRVAVPRDPAVQDAAACDQAHARDPDRHHDLDLALVDLAVARLAEALGGPLHVLGELVDDVVLTD